MMVWTGYLASIADGLEISIWSIFENTDVPLSLLTGGLAGTILAGILYMLKMKQNETASYPLMGRAFVSGLKSMLPAVFILNFCMGINRFNSGIRNRRIFI